MGNQVKKKIKELLQRLDKETALSSRTEVNHPAYLELVELGDSAINPLIEYIKTSNCLKIVSDEHAPGIWYALSALVQIANHNFIKEKSAGNLLAIIADCVEWSNKRG